MGKIPNSARYLLFVMMIFALGYPLYGDFLFGDKYDFFLQKITTIMILAILALSVDLLVGVVNMVSIGQVAFYGVASYALVLLSPEFEAISIWYALPISLAIAAITALIIGILIVHTSGIFFIMATIAFTQMLYYIFKDASFAGGSDGIFLMFKPEVKIANFELLNLDNKITLFYFVLFSLIVIYLLLRVLLKSPFGYVLFGIKENELRVQALGYNTRIYKLVAFVIAGVIAGYSGFLSVTQYGYANPSNFNWILSAQALLMVIVGGMGTLFGAIFGAFLFEGLHYWYSSLTEHWELLMGISVVILVLVLPDGLAGILLSKRHAPKDQ